jgi:hypothetical protein
MNNMFKNKKSSNIFYIILAIISFLILFLDKIGPYQGKIAHLGFIIFTVLFIAIGINNRKSPKNIILIILFYLIFLGVYLKDNF